MRTLNSRFMLIDLHSSWRSANRIPLSAFSFLQNSNLLSSVSSSFRRSRRSRKGIGTSSSSVPGTGLSSSSLRSPEIRRPSDRFSAANGLPLPTPSTSTSTSSRADSASEMELFLELIPLRMRNGLLCHPQIPNLIEVVMDLGRKPLARFPSGDWVMSEQPVKLEDLRHAISKVLRWKLKGKAIGQGIQFEVEKGIKHPELWADCKPLHGCLQKSSSRDFSII